jgi:predicted nucleic acid-binding protein
LARFGNDGEAEAQGVAAGGSLIVVLDTGGVEGLAPIDEARRARLRLLRERADDLVLPAAVLAESVLNGHPGHDFHVQRLLEMLNITDVDAPLGHAAGALRRAAIAAGQDPRPSGVDAMVVAAADERAANDEVLFVTSDADDFGLLGSLAGHSDRLSVLGL